MVAQHCLHAQRLAAHARSGGRVLPCAHRTCSWQPARGQARTRAPPAAAAGPNDAAAVPPNEQSAGFGKLERQMADNLATRQPELRDEWSELAGCWVLSPPISAGRPKAVIHFLGGAFVGAVPQLSYRGLLEALAAKGYLIVAAPYATGFNHTRIAGQTQFKFESCMRALNTDPSLPVFGLGHSMGSLLHLLAATQLPVQRAGNVLMSFNNKDVLEAIPFFAPLIAPGARALGPILARLAASPLRSQVEAPLEMLRGLSPALVQQALPVLDQLLPIYMDVANGRQQFTPAPEETRAALRSSYGIPRNLLVQFEDDAIDETAALAALLRADSAVSSQLDLTVSVLPGDHATPLQASLGSLPPELQGLFQQGNQALEQFAGMAQQAGGQMGGQFQELAQGLSSFAAGLNGGPAGGQPAAIELLAETIDAWLQSQHSAWERQLPAAGQSSAP